MTFLPEMHNLSLDTRLLGICTLGDGRVTELFKGPQGGLYYLSPSEQRMSVASNDERIEFMDPEDVETRLQAAAEPKVGLGDKDRQLARLDLGLEHLHEKLHLNRHEITFTYDPLWIPRGPDRF